MSLQPRGGELGAEDGVRVAEGAELVLGDVADYAYGEAGAREGLARDEALGQAELAAELAHLVLEEHAQRLYYRAEVDAVGQAAHVVVALYDRGVARAGLYDVGVYRALGEELHGVRVFLASASKTRMNSSPIMRRLRSGSVHAGETCTRKRSRASTRTKLSSLPEKTRSTSSASPRR